MLLMRNAWFTDKLTSANQHEWRRGNMARRWKKGCNENWYISCAHVREMKIYTFFGGAMIKRDARARNLWHEKRPRPNVHVRGAESGIQIAFTILSDRSLHVSRSQNVIIYIAALVRCESCAARVCQMCFASQLFRIPFSASNFANKLNHEFSFWTKNFVIRMWDGGRLPLSQLSKVKCTYILLVIRMRALAGLESYKMVCTLHGHATPNGALSANTIKIKIILEATLLTGNIHANGRHAAAAAMGDSAWPNEHRIYTIRPMLRCMWNLKLKWIEIENLLLVISRLLHRCLSLTLSLALLFQFCLSLACFTIFSFFLFVSSVCSVSVCLVQLWLVVMLTVVCSTCALCMFQLFNNSKCTDKRARLHCFICISTHDFFFRPFSTARRREWGGLNFAVI